LFVLIRCADYRDGLTKCQLTASKKRAEHQIVWRVFLSLISLLAKLEWDHRGTITGFVLLSGAHFNRALFFDYPISTIHASSNSNLYGNLPIHA
jgi:hypothetical protein